MIMKIIKPLQSFWKIFLYKSIVIFILKESHLEFLALRERNVPNSYGKLILSLINYLSATKYFYLVDEKLNNSMLNSTLVLSQDFSQYLLYDQIYFLFSQLFPRKTPQGIIKIRLYKDFKTLKKIRKIYLGFPDFSF